MFREPIIPGTRERKPARADLAGVVGRILAYRIGLDLALRRSDILRLVKQLPEYRAATDHMIRVAIEDLREGGWLVCSLMDDSGYFVAGNPDEYRRFRALYISYAATIWQRVKAMDREVEKRWGTMT